MTLEKYEFSFRIQRLWNVCIGLCWHVEVRTGIWRPIPLKLLLAKEAEPKNRPGRATAGDWQQRGLSGAFQCFYRDILRGSGHAAMMHCQRLVGANQQSHSKGICLDKHSWIRDSFSWHHLTTGTVWSCKPTGTVTLVVLFMGYGCLHLNLSYLYYHVGSVVTYCGFLDAQTPGCSSGSRWVSHCTTALCVNLPHAAPLGDGESAAGTPCPQWSQNHGSSSRDLCSSCCRSPYNLCTVLHRQNL